MARNVDVRGGQWLADMAIWMRNNASDNSELLTRLCRNLRLAREQELTPRQQEVLALYYDQGLNIPQIAAQLGVNCSTISRTIRRARQRLYRCLRYSL